MPRVKIQLADNIKRVVTFDTDATVGATLGANLFMPNGQIGTPASVLQWLGGALPAGSSGGGNNGIPVGNYLTTKGDLLTRDTQVQRLPIGTLDQALRVSAGGLPEWRSGAALSKVDDTNVTLALGGTPLTSLLAATSLTLGWTGQLSAIRGGTGFGSYTAGDTLYANTTTTLAKLAIGAAGDLLRVNSGAPAWTAPVAMTKVDDTNVTLALGGAPATSLVAATSLTLGWTGTLSVPRGGTGFGSYTLGDLVYADGTASLAKLAIGTAGYIMKSTAGIPAWIAPAALTKVDDTNVTLALGGSAATALINAASLTLGWTGQLSVPRGGTGFGSYTVGDLLYADTTTTLAKRAATTDGFVLTLAAGIPTWAAAAGGSSPLTTKGDLFGYSTVNARIPVGANGEVLIADSTVALGVKWGAAGSGSPASPTRSVQFNNAGVFGGSANLTYSANSELALVGASSGSTLTVGQTIATGGFVLEATGNIVGVGLVRNTNGGTAAGALWDVTNGTDTLAFFMAGTAYSGSPLSGGPSGTIGAIYNNTAKDLVFGTNLTARGYIASSGEWNFISQAICQNIFRITSTTPQIIFNETDGGTNAKRWTQYANVEVMHYGIYNDAESVIKDYLAITRSAGAPLVMTYGNSTDNPSHAFYGQPTFNVESGGAWTANIASGGAIFAAGSGVNSRIRVVTAASSGNLADIRFATDSTDRAYVGVPLNGSSFFTGGTANALCLRAEVAMQRGSGTSLYETMSSAGAFRWHAYGAGTLTTDASGNITAVSDERAKRNIRPFQRGTQAILGLETILHGYAKSSGLDQTKNDYAGFRAQNVRKFIPEAVGQDAHGMLTLNMNPVLAAAVNAIKELNARIEALEAL